MQLSKNLDQDKIEFSPLNEKIQGRGQLRFKYQQQFS